MEKIEFIKSLAEIINNKLFLTDSTQNLEEEIAKNCHLISIDKKLASEIQPKELLDILKKVRENRLSQLNQSNLKANLKYYSWFDEQACQLRFNIINSNHPSLPFGAKINIVDNESVIVKAFIASNYHDGIPWEDFNKLETDIDNTEEKESGFILDVYLKELMKK